MVAAARGRQHQEPVITIFFGSNLFFLSYPAHSWVPKIANVANMLSISVDDATTAVAAYMTGNTSNYSNTNQFYNIAPAPGGSSAYDSGGFRADDAARNFFPEGLFLHSLLK